MTFEQAFVLGVVQGLTEFLPVSSSGHLLLLETFWDLRIDPRSLLGFNVVLHAGTLLALFWVYRRTWCSLLRSLVSSNVEERRMIVLLIVATIPAGIVGVLLVDAVAGSGIIVTALGFLATAVLLIVAERFRSERTMTGLAKRDAFLIGCAQAIALLPGFSRSGFTYGAGRVATLGRIEALDFSFLMAVPAIAGATFFTAADVWAGNAALPAGDVLFIGFLASTVASAAAILLLRLLVRRISLAWFALYLIPLSVALLAQALRQGSG